MKQKINKKFKRILSLLLSFVVLLSMMPLNLIVSFADTPSGQVEIRDDGTYGMITNNIYYTNGGIIPNYSKDQAKNVI